MFVELIEVLRCPRDHGETPLIVSATRTADRHVLDGVLGCPHCHAEFPIVDGVARFADVVPLPREEAPDAEAAMRLAAFLELVDARGFALLFGRWGVHADQLRRISDTPVILVNPATRAIGDVAGTIVADTRLPLAPLSARAAALDDSTSSELAESAVRSVQPGGRMVGPVRLTLPDGLQELVRDDRLWVAEKTAAPEAAPRLTVLQRSKR